MAEIQVDGHRVWYSTGGADWSPGRPLVILLHGAGGDHTVWALQSRALAQHGWNVAAADLPGHGRSEDQSGLDSVEALAAWTGRLIESLGEVKAMLSGHSMGACIALTLAAREPERISALTLLGAGAAMPVSEALLHDTRDRPERAQAFITAYAHGRPSHFGGMDSPGIWLLGAGQALLERCPAPVLHRDFAMCGAWNGAPFAIQVRCPTLVLSGELDRMVPAKAGRDLAELIGGARFETISGTGHMMMGEAPGAVTRALRSFLGETAAGEKPDA